MIDSTMATRAMFPAAAARAGMYESFYLRTVSPGRPVSLWIRYTVHKRPGEAAHGAIWCTVFDGERGAPFMHKLGSLGVTVPDGGWLRVGEQAAIGPGMAEGVCGAARWSLRFDSDEEPLAHLRPAWLYRAPLPRTKLTSPAPAARFEGSIELPGREPLLLDGWPGMVGHNWGAEHAARWIWLSGCDFAGGEPAWLDVVLGRVMLAGRLTPWVASGALSLAGRRLALGGLGRRPSVAESPAGAVAELGGPGGTRLRARVSVPAETAAGWRYADPRGGTRDVVNCSIAGLELTARLPDGVRELSTAHGGAYELGSLSGADGAVPAVPIAPFADG